MRKLWLVLLLIFLLAACGGGDDDDGGNDDDSDSNVNNPSADATEEAFPPDQARPVMSPGLVTNGNVEVVRSTTYTAPNGVIGWVVLEVRHTNESPIQNFLLAMNILDGENRLVQALNLTSPFLNIPAGVTVPLVVTFTPSDDYNGSYAALVEPENLRADILESFVGEFNLPTTVDAFTRTDEPLVVTGTITNDRGMDLRQPVVAVILSDAEGNLVAATYATVTLPEAGVTLPAGASVPFEAQFFYVPPVEGLTAQVIAAAYQ